MDDNPNKDVNIQSDTTTDAGSSPVDQTSGANDSANENSNAPVNEQQNQAPETLADGSLREDKTVPFTRLQQEIEKRAAAEERARILESQRQQPQYQQPQEQVNPEVQQAKQQLKALMQDLAPELGFVSKQEIQQQQAIQSVGNEHTRLGNKYSGADGLPKYDANAVQDYAIKMGFSKPEHLEIAYNQMHNAQIIQAKIDRAMQQSRGIQTEQSNGTGSANTGVSDNDLLKAAKDGDKDATHLILKRRLSSK